MNDREMTLVIQWLERRKRWVQTEETIEVQHILLLDRNRRPHRVIVLFLERHNDVQPVGRSTLKQHYKPLVVGSRSRRFRHDATQQEARNHRSPNQCERTTLQEAAPRWSTLQTAFGEIPPAHIATPVACVYQCLSHRVHSETPDVPILSNPN